MALFSRLPTISCALAKNLPSKHVFCSQNFKQIHSLPKQGICVQFKKATNFSSYVVKMNLRLQYFGHSSHGSNTICAKLLKKHGTNLVHKRLKSQHERWNMSKTDAMLYAVSLTIVACGGAYVGVPFFKLFCRQFGLGGNPEYARSHNTGKIEQMARVEDRILTVYFTADKHASMKWNFRPQQQSIKVVPGETALAFYTAENPTEEQVIGISTYTIMPYTAAPYFNKIQCFCFEEQILNPHEKVDMPVFFYIDPDFDEDPELEFEDSIVLSYTFFQAKEGMSLSLPGFLSGGKKEAAKPQPAA